MNKETVNKLILIASIMLVIAGACFLSASLWGNHENNAPLACALGCIILSSLFNIIRQIRNKEN